MDELNYEIYADGKLVACFLYKQDRDMCADFLQNTFDDLAITQKDKNVTGTIETTPKKNAINLLNILIEENVSDREWAKDVDEELYHFFKGKVQGYKLALKIVGGIRCDK